MNTDRKDTLVLKGVFELRKYDVDDNLIETYIEENLIVNGGRTAIATLLAAATSGKAVTKIGFGTNGADPVLTDTALTGSFVKAVAGFTYPATGQVRFSWSLELSEGNGMTIREYGLICTDNTVFARKTRAEIAKDNTVRLEGFWTIIC